MASRWFIVSNRLPFGFSPQGQLTPSSGGLVTAIQGVKSEAEKVWCGVAPDGMSPELWDKSVSQLKSQFGYLPVFIDEHDYNLFYNGFCNDVLWPLHHYEPSYVNFTQEAWDAYIRVNEKFADTLAATLKDDDLVWIHDFQLYLLPKFLKERNPRVKVGFFLHTPFPSSEIFRQIPVRKQILESVIQADLVSFQDYSYLRHFCSSVLRILGIDSDFKSIQSKRHRCGLGVYPVSLDTEDWLTQASRDCVVERAKSIPRSEFLLLGVDRLDYIKGVDLKLQAFAAFLKAKLFSIGTTKVAGRGE
jgi:trehalose-6-phosphate synthase